MIPFKPLELDDRELFLKYLKDYNFNTYEYSFLTLYLWRKMCNTQFSIIDGTLVIRKSGKCTASYFMQPVGYTKDTLESVLTKLNLIKNSCPGYKNLFRDIEYPFLSILKEIYGKGISYREDVNNFDYIYTSQDLISLSGHKYHGKKNHYNHFISNYNYEVKDLYSEHVVNDCIKFAKDWYDKRGNKSEQLKYEFESTEDILKHADLLNIKGIAVYVDNSIAGFAIGEKVNSDMAIVHIEKSDLQYSGIYSFINKALAEKYFSDVSFINRQEDLGIEGLRKAKMAYHPVRLEKKYIIDLYEEAVHEKYSCGCRY